MQQKIISPKKINKYVTLKNYKKSYICFFSIICWRPWQVNLKFASLSRFLSLLVCVCWCVACDESAGVLPRLCPVQSSLSLSFSILFFFVLTPVFGWVLGVDTSFYLYFTSSSLIKSHA